MTKQEVFNKVWNNFLIEGRPFSYDEEEEICKYRHSNGVRCAIGIFIKDEEYSIDMEGLSVLELENLPSALRDVDKTFLKRLQEAHDFGAFNCMGNSSLVFKTEMEFIARDYDIQIPGEE